MNTQQTPQLQNVLNPSVEVFFDNDSNTFSYVVSDPSSQSCAVIDPVRDFDYPSGKITGYHADSIIEYIQKNKLHLEWIIETHVHADHLSAAAYIQEKLGGKIAISEKVTIIQKTFGGMFNEDDKFARDGSQFDHLFYDGELYKIGNLEAKAMLTPGHTPACMTHLMGNCAFVGDTIFRPDQGTARADFPGGSAAELYDSIQKIFALTDDTRLFMCHDYNKNQPNLAFESSVIDEKANNIHVHSSIEKIEFIEIRETRDQTLQMPRYLLPSIQVNMRAGRVPEPEDNGLSFLKIPINAFEKN